MNFIKAHLKDCLYIAVIAVFLLLYIFKPGRKSEVTGLKQEIELLNTKSKSDYDSINRLQKNLIASDSVKAKLESAYQLNKTKYVQIIKELHTKDSIISTLSVMELQKQFSDRYKSSN